VHRLINEKDRQFVGKACGNIDASAAAFLSTLGQGEANIVGIESPIPLSIKIISPTAEPESEGPQYDEYWFRKTNDVLPFLFINEPAMLDDLRRMNLLTDLSTVSFGHVTADQWRTLNDCFSKLTGH